MEKANPPLKAWRRTNVASERSIEIISEPRHMFIKYNERQISQVINVNCATTIMTNCLLTSCVSVLLCCHNTDCTLSPWLFIPTLKKSPDYYLWLVVREYLILCISLTSTKKPQIAFKIKHLLSHVFGLFSYSRIT